MPDLEQRIVAAVQQALNDEARVTPTADPLAMYRPSPGQLPDHVHHRITVIAARAAVAVFGAPPAWLCWHCGRASWNPHDGENGYCGACKHVCREYDLQVALGDLPLPEL